MSYGVLAVRVKGSVGGAREKTMLSSVFIHYFRDLGGLTMRAGSTFSRRRFCEETRKFGSSRQSNAYRVIGTATGSFRSAGSPSSATGQKEAGTSAISQAFASDRCAIIADCAAFVNPSFGKIREKTRYIPQRMIKL